MSFPFRIPTRIPTGDRKTVLGGFVSTSSFGDWGARIDAEIPQLQSTSSFGDWTGFTGETEVQQLQSVSTFGNWGVRIDADIPQLESTSAFGDAIVAFGAVVEQLVSESTFGDWSIPPVFPTMPPDFSASRDSAKTTVTLTWGDPGDHKTFEIWRASDFEPSDGYTLIDTVDGDVFQYVDNVDAGPDYAYRIASVSYTTDRSTRTPAIYTLGEESESLD